MSVENELNTNMDNPSCPPVHDPCGEDEQNMEALWRLYYEYQKAFEKRNFEAINDIIASINAITRGTPLLYLIRGEQYLYSGNSEKSYQCLQKYIKFSPSVDNYALGVIAMWNAFSGYPRLALTQLGASIESKRELTRTHIHQLFTMVNIKKKIGFLDSATEYLERMLAVPGGYEINMLIRLEDLHILIKKGNFHEALMAHTTFPKDNSPGLLKRLHIYILYKTKAFKEILAHKTDRKLDPYISYILGRIGFENAELSVDCSYYFDQTLKSTGHNEFVYLSYGNYYFRAKRYSDAAEYYQNALAIDPTFYEAHENLRQLKRMDPNASGIVYLPHEKEEEIFSLKDIDPDPETLGFLNYNTFFGYAPLKIDYEFSTKTTPLQFEPYWSWKYL
ncbi:hypothetical protein ENBRE01_0108 [Enteropsectra breve]|nr:hypothetical protein ENBRE01_0108 [Enteropsectra breve]